MSVSIRLLFDTPQQEIASLIRDRMDRCVTIWIVSGFATVEGFGALFPTLSGNSEKLRKLVVGAGTFRSFELFDDLLHRGVAPDRLMIHLGHSRLTQSSAKHSFYRYHPMLHSKIYLLENEDGTATAFVGSHNLTGFAMYGLNGEASILLEGRSDSHEFNAIRKHIERCIAQSTQYSPTLKEGYTWWTVQFMEGLRDKVNDAPRDGEGKLTIIVLATTANANVPKRDDVIYFEIPSALGQIQSLQAEVHIYVFNKRPASPLEALNNLESAVTSLWCKTLGLEKEKGGVELRADWQVISSRDPRMVRVTQPFRPITSSDMQQVRVKVFKNVFDKYEYLFSGGKEKWEPVFNEDATVQIPSDEIALVKKLNLVPPEDKEWYLVTDLKPAESESGQMKYALEITAPESGAFILFSRRRRKRNRD